MATTTTIPVTTHDGRKMTVEILWAQDGTSAHLATVYDPDLGYGAPPPSVQIDGAGRIYGALARPLPPAYAEALGIAAARFEHP